MCDQFMCDQLVLVSRQLELEKMVTVVQQVEKTKTARTNYDDQKVKLELECRTCKKKNLCITRHGKHTNY